jgi:hypothetical protein
MGNMQIIDYKKIFSVEDACRKVRAEVYQLKLKDQQTPDIQQSIHHMQNKIVYLEQILDTFEQEGVVSISEPDYVWIKASQKSA